MRTRPAATITMPIGKRQKIANAGPAPLSPIAAVSPNKRQESTDKAMPARTMFGNPPDRRAIVWVEKTDRLEPEGAGAVFAALAAGFGISAVRRAVGRDSAGVDESTRSVGLVVRARVC